MTTYFWIQNIVFISLAYIVAAAIRSIANAIYLEAKRRYDQWVFAQDRQIDEIIKEIVTAAVKAAEQIGQRLEGKEKKAIATEYALKYLEDVGIEVDRTVIDLLIEKIVFELFNATKLVGDTD